MRICPAKARRPEALGGGASFVDVLLEGGELAPEAGQDLIDPSQIDGQAAELLCLVRAIKAVRQLADSALEAQALCLQLERSRVSVRERMLHLREEGLGGVGAAHIQLVTNALEKR